MKKIKIAINGNTYQDKYIDSLRDFLFLLTDEGFDVDIEEQFYAYLSERITTLPKGLNHVVEPAEDSTAVISIGGDGTFLHTAQWVGRRQIPVLGINTGHLGFLSVSCLNESKSIIEALKNGSFVIEPRAVLNIVSDNLPEDIWPYALNEVAILKQNTSAMISIRTEINDFYLTDYLVDGLIISTPTGSTGYNMSVGGPILQPTVDNWILSPIAPHSLTMRPLVVSSKAKITATTSSRTDSYRISLDGRSFSMPCDTVVAVQRADFDVFVMRRKGDNFAATIRNKLLWGVR